MSLPIIAVLRRRKEESTRVLEDFYVRGATTPESGDSSSSGTVTPSPASPGAKYEKRVVVTKTVVEEDLGYPSVPLTGREEPVASDEPVAATTKKAPTAGGEPALSSTDEETPANMGDEPVAATTKKAPTAGGEPALSSTDEETPANMGDEPVAAATKKAPTVGGAPALSSTDEEMEPVAEPAVEPTGEEEETEPTPVDEPEPAAEEPAAADVEVMEVKKEVEVITLSSTSSESEASSQQAKRKRQGDGQESRPSRRKKAKTAVPTMEDFAKLQATVRELQAKLEAAEGAGGADDPESDAETEAEAHLPSRIILDFPAEASSIKYNKIEQALPLNTNEEFENILSDTDGQECLDRIIDQIIVEELTSDNKRKKRWISKVVHTLFSNYYITRFKVYYGRENYTQKAGTAMEKGVFDWLEASVMSTIRALGLDEDTYSWRKFVLKMRDVWRYTRSNVKKRKEEKEEKEGKKQ